jgi:hypothetical protein
MRVSTHPSRGTRSKRAVSDTLAFVLTFSIIITSVGLVYGVGFASLNDIRDGQQEINAQQTFEATSADINEIRDGSAVSRSAQIELRGGSLSVTTDSQVRIAINDSKTVYSGDLGSFVYRIEEGTVMGYEGGATFGKYGTSSVMTSGPKFQCNVESNTTVISVVVLESESGSIGSTGSVVIDADKTNETLVFPTEIAGDQDVDNVTIRISNSPFQTTWTEKFDNWGDWSHVSGNTYKCDTERVYVRKTTVEIVFG